MNFAVLPDPVATARGSDTPSLRLGEKQPVLFKTPLMGLLKTIAFQSPGVNAWATEKSFKSGHYRGLRRLDSLRYKKVQL